MLRAMLCCTLALCPGLACLCLSRTRRGDARDAAASRSRATGEGGGQPGSDSSDEEGSGPAPASFPGEAQLGDVVEYPLSAAVKDRLNDGREKGIAQEYFSSIIIHRRQGFSVMHGPLRNEAGRRLD